MADRVPGEAYDRARPGGPPPPHGPWEAPAWHLVLLKHMNEPPLPSSWLHPELPGGWRELIVAL
ncbi:hypothetical protein [Streptomyces sp. NPDC047043]|uniref:hypothetical protein n=1 Tax=Streptomyces sp. NPDC047043 TaxID=3154497 RepID=UPI00340E51B8